VFPGGRRHDIREAFRIAPTMSWWKVTPTNCPVQVFGQAQGWERLLSMPMPIQSRRDIDRQRVYPTVHGTRKSWGSIYSPMERCGRLPIPIKSCYDFFRVPTRLQLFAADGIEKCWNGIFE